MPNKPEKIFLVDDDPYCRHLIEHAVRSHGFIDVHLFESGEACLDALSEGPDIIFLDQTMGSMSGTDALQAIKRFNPDTYVVLVSGQRHMQEAVNLLELGAFDYVLKDEHLTKRLAEVLDQVGAVSKLLAQRPPLSSQAVHCQTVRNSDIRRVQRLATSVAAAAGRAGGHHYPGHVAGGKHFARYPPPGLSAIADRPGN